MPAIDFTESFNFVLLTLAMFAVVLGRYFLIAGIFYVIFYVWFPKHWTQRRLGKADISRKQFYSEVKWSIVTAAIFALAGACVVVLWQSGLTKIYVDIHKYSLWYLPVSLATSLLIHETYYYWLHRWMHKPRVFNIIHKVHHESNTTSPWTAFSFHPFEGLLQSLILPLTIVFLPMHLYVLLFQLTIMTFSSVINHLEIEIYPAGSGNFFGRWVIGATHHSLHHKQFKYNYGLYFTIWDKLSKTESPRFKTLFSQKIAKR